MGSFASPLGTLGVEITGDASDLLSAFDRVEQAAKDTDTEISRLDFAAGMATSVSKNMDEVRQKFEGLGNVGQGMMTVGAGLTASITAPLVGLGVAAVSTAEQINTAKVAFTTMLGSAGAADTMLKNLQQFAAQTPFEFPDLVSAAQRMKALGFETDKIIPTLRSVGDTAAAMGGGKDVIAGITKALGDMQQKGKVSAEEMMQLAERGVPAWDILAKAIGVSIPEAMKMAEKGAISATTAVPALLDGMNQKFGGSMEAMSKTLTGQWSNMKDQLTQALIPIGQMLIPALQSLLPVLTLVLTKVGEFATWFGQLPAPVLAAAGVMAGFAAALGPILLALGGIATAVAAAMPALVGLAGFFGTSVALLAPWALAIGAVLAALVALGVWVSENWEPITAALAQAWSGITEIWNATWTGISSWITGVWNDIAAAATTLFEPAVTFFTSIWEGINIAWDAAWGAIGGTLTAAWNAVGSAVRTVWEPIASFFSTIWDGLTKYFGGIWDGIAKGMTGVWESIRDVAERVWNAIGEAIRGFIGWAEKIPGVNKLFNLDDAWKSAGKLKEHTDKATGSVKSFGEAAGKAAGTSAAPVPKLTKATKEAGEAAEKTASQIKPLRETSELLIATQKILNAEHDKHITNLAKSQIEASKWKDWVQQMIVPADDLADSLKAINGELTSYANKHAPAALAKITEINAEVPKQTTAVKDLATASKTAYTEVATHAGTAAAAVKGDPSTVGTDVISLSFKSWKDTATDLKTAVPTLIDGMLGNLGTKITDKLPSLTGPFGDLKTAATSAIGTFVTDASALLFSGEGNWGDKVKTLLGDLGSAVMSSFVTPAKTAIEGFINGVLADLIGGKGLGGVTESIKGIGSALSGLFGGGGGKGPIGIPGGDLGSHVDDIFGTGGKAPASGAAGAAGAGLAGIVGAVSGVVSAVSGVVSNFQFAGMNKSLDLIERYTRYSEIHLSHILEDGVNKWLPKLDQINGFLWEHFATWFADLMSTTEEIRDIVRSFKFPIDWTMNFTDMNRQTLYEIRDTLYDIRGYLETTRDNTGMMKDKLTSGQTWTVQFTGDPIARLVGDEIMRQLRMQGINLV